jgi:uncharacterized protein
VSAVRNLDPHKFPNKYLAKYLTKLFSLVFALLLAFAPTVFASEPSDLPELAEIEAHNWVIDFANSLSSYTEGQVNTKLEQLTAETGEEVRFVTVARIDFGQPTSEFVRELFQRWFPTPEAQAKQTLVLIATEDRRTAIAQGSKAKALTTEDIAKSIEAETVFFPTQKAEFNRAVTEGSDRLIAVLSGQPDPGAPVLFVAPEVETAPAKPEDPQTTTLWVVGLLIAATVIPMVTYYALGRPS